MVSSFWHHKNAQIRDRILRKIAQSNPQQIVIQRGELLSTLTDICGLENTVTNRTAVSTVRRVMTDYSWIIKDELNDGYVLKLNDKLSPEQWQHIEEILKQE